MVDGLHVRSVGSRTYGVGGETGPGGGGGGSAKKPSGKPIAAGGADIQFGENVNDTVFRLDGFSSTVTESFSSSGGLAGTTFDGTDPLVAIRNLEVGRVHDGYSDTVTNSFDFATDYGRNITVDANLDPYVVAENVAVAKHSGYTSSIDGSVLFNDIRGVSIGKNDLYNSETSTPPQKIRRYSGFTDTLKDSFTAQGAVHDLSFDGGGFYSINDDTDSIYKYDGFSGSVVGSFSHPGGSQGRSIESGDFKGRTNKSI